MIDTRAAIVRDNPLKLPRPRVITDFTLGSWVRYSDDEQSTPQMVIDRSVEPGCPKLVGLDGTINHPTPNALYIGLNCALHIFNDVPLPPA